MSELDSIELSDDVEEFAETSIPDNPGPAALGRTPVIGELRREKGLPVLRDEVPNVVGSM